MHPLAQHLSACPLVPRLLPVVRLSAVQLPARRSNAACAAARGGGAAHAIARSHLITGARALAAAPRQPRLEAAAELGQGAGC
jgi:hypothetical protein